MISIIIFDGDCGFCNRTIMFFAKNDVNNCFKFISNNSDFGKGLLQKIQILGLEQSTIVLIENDNTFTRSSAIWRILLKIPKYRMLGFSLLLIPKKVSDWFYDFISNRRKRIVNNNDCEIPTLEMRKKFIL